MAQLRDYAKIEDAIKAAQTMGLDIQEPHYAIIGIEGGRALYDTTRLTGYYLNPQGLIQKTRDGWCLVTS
jgi:hypothetical protein